LNRDLADLVAAACEARRRSYSPYSGFRVGAAVRDDQGRVHVGTNVENASFGLSICAERAAVFRAVADGARTLAAVAICADGVEPTSPCGACRQVLLEFGPDMTVVLAGENGMDGPLKEFTARELVPDAFLDFRGGGRNAEGPR
jgi:cytidine deaminase